MDTLLDALLLDNDQQHDNERQRAVRESMVRAYNTPEQVAALIEPELKAFLIIKIKNILDQTGSR